MILADTGWMKAEVKKSVGKSTFSWYTAYANRKFVFCGGPFGGRLHWRHWPKVMRIVVHDRPAKKRLAVRLRNIDLFGVGAHPCWQWAGRHRRYDAFVPKVLGFIQGHPRWTPEVARKGITVYLEVQTRA